MKKTENNQEFTDKLSSALTLSEDAPEVSPESNQVVNNVIRKRAATIRADRTTYMFNWVYKIAAIAAISMLALAAIVYQVTSDKPELPVARAHRDDINHDGSINIIDAYLLAKQQPGQEQRLKQLINQTVSLEGKI